MERQPVDALGALVEGVTAGVGAATGVSVLGLAVVGGAGPAWQNALLTGSHLTPMYHWSVTWGEMERQPSPLPPVGGVLGGSVLGGSVRSTCATTNAAATAAKAFICWSPLRRESEQALSRTRRGVNGAR
jgi:hypothetical protein